MTASATPPPRIYCIPAAEAPVVAVLRRGPTEWWQVGRWDLSALSFEPGAWFRAQLYPQKCDVSPDGRFLAYSALNHGSHWAAGEIYEAISRLPWLHALAAWEAGTTYTRGIHFTPMPGECALGEPDVGDVQPLLRRYGLALNRAEQFSVERRRGWTETDDSEPRDPQDAWDERRIVRMRKARPGASDRAVDGLVQLRVEGSYAGMRNLPHLRDPASYALSKDDEVQALEDVQWADWDSGGRLLLVTTSGRLQLHDDPFDLSKPQFDHDLAPLRPDPVAPPTEATQW